jgi:serine protease Do
MAGVKRFGALATGFTASTALLAGCGGAAKPSSHPPATSSSSAASATATAATSTATRPSAINLADLVAKVQSGIIRIETTTCQGEAIGSGFLIGPRLVATVEHVVDGATFITLKRSGSIVATGTVIGEDTYRDVALIRTDRPIHGFRLTLAPRAPRLGEDVAALGFPFGLPLTVTRGTTSGLDRTIPINGINRTRLVQTDASANPGNSGGPLLSVQTGEVVGLVDLLATQAHGIAFAVSAQVAGPLLQDWAASPQPVSTTSCNGGSSQQAAPPPPQPTAPESALTTFPGSFFSIGYPSTWRRCGGRTRGPL